MRLMPATVPAGSTVHRKEVEYRCGVLWSLLWGCCSRLPWFRRRRPLSLAIL